MKFARWIIQRLAPAEWRESLEGDINEERARRQTAGRHAGWIWTLTQAIGLVHALHLEARRGVMVHRRGGIMDGVWQDVRMSVRSLRATPGVTAVAVLVLALGIGAGTAIYSVVDAVLLRPLPFDSPDRLVALGEVDKPRVDPEWAVGSAAAPTYLDWVEMQDVFESLGASRVARDFTVRDSGEPEDLPAVRVTTSLFDVLRVRPQLGRLFTAENERDGLDRVLLISDRLWKRRFDSDALIVGKTITFDSGAWEIIGVLPPEFQYPVNALRPTDVVAPYVVPERERIRNRGQTGRNYNLRVVGRLKDGVTLEQARGEMVRMTSTLEATYPDWFSDRTWGLATLHQSTVGRARSWMLLLLGAVACLLLIACANVANLTLVRATGRSRELMVRAALGASRWRIARALLIESLVLSTAGLVVALLVAMWGVSTLRASMPGNLPRIAEVGLNLRVLGAAAAAAVLTAIVCGLIPALQLSRPAVQSALREGGRTSSAGRVRQGVRSALVVIEVALAVILLVGAGLFVSSFVRLVTVDLGIDHREVLATGLNPRITQVDNASLKALRDRSSLAVTEVLARVRALPGVSAAAAVSGGAPLSGSYKTTSLAVVGGREFSRTEDEVQVQEVSPGYFEVVRQPLRLGRVIDAQDSASAPAVAVVNDEAVARYFSGENPLGRRVVVDNRERTIIGVVGNVRLRGPEVPVSPGIYFPMAQAPAIGATILVRSSDDTGATASGIRSAVLAMVPGVPVFQKSMGELLRGLTEQRQFNMLLVGVFGVLAIAIACVGIYSVMSYAVALQRQEIGVRMALGARPQRVLGMVLTRASAIMLAGMVLGMAAAWGAATLIEAFLFVVSPHDPLVFGGAAALLLSMGLLAAFVPALRAARVDPIVALRLE